MAALARTWQQRRSARGGRHSLSRGRGDGICDGQLRGDEGAAEEQHGGRRGGGGGEAHGVRVLRLASGGEERKRRVRGGACVFACSAEHRGARGAVDGATVQRGVGEAEGGAGCAARSEEQVCGVGVCGWVGCSRDGGWRMEERRRATTTTPARPARSEMHSIGCRLVARPRRPAQAQARHAREGQRGAEPCSSRRQTAAAQQAGARRAAARGAPDVRAATARLPCARAAQMQLGGTAPAQRPHRRRA